MSKSLAMDKNQLMKFKKTIYTSMSPLLLASFVNIPLDSQTWRLIDFGKIATNKLHHSEKSMTISVNESASPIVHQFKTPQKITGFKVRASLKTPLAKIPDGKTQGQSNADDFILRFGLIAKGNTKLGWIERQMAPAWLLEMEKMAPQGMGVESVYFYSTCRDQRLFKKPRQNPMHSSLKEECLAFLTAKGAFVLQKQLDTPIEAIGLWIAADGDNLKQSFELEIQEIQLTLE